MKEQPNIKYIPSRVKYTHGQKIVLFHWKEHGDDLAMAIPLKG